MSENTPGQPVHRDARQVWADLERVWPLPHPLAAVEAARLIDELVASLEVARTVLSKAFGIVDCGFCGQGIGHGEYCEVEQ